MNVKIKKKIIRKIRIITCNVNGQNQDLEYLLNPFSNNDNINLTLISKTHFTYWVLIKINYQLITNTSEHPICIMPIFKRDRTAVIIIQFIKH